MATDGTGRFGVLLQRHRTDAALSQEELAERAGVSRRGIADLERGARRSPHPATVRQLADALKLNDADRAALIAAGHRGDKAAARRDASPQAVLEVEPEPDDKNRLHIAVQPVPGEGAVRSQHNLPIMLGSF